MNLTRAKFDELTHDLVERTATPVSNALRDAGITASELGKVLLVGGSTRIPAVQGFIILRKLTLTLKDININCALVICRCREYLALLSWDGCISLNQPCSYPTHREKATVQADIDALKAVVEATNPESISPDDVVIIYHRQRFLLP